MSTPQTSTATLPPPHQYYNHRQYPPPYMSATSQYSQSYSTNTSIQDYRRTAASSSSSRPENKLPPLQNSTRPSQAASRDMSSRSQKKHSPDWREFYKNGVPKEVIVIDDSPEPQKPNHYDGLYDRHTDKKRKTASSAHYDPVYNPQTSYSTTQTPYDQNSSTNHTVSTDRTAPMYKGTGSSSTGSAVTTFGYYQQLEDSTAGQKRKRNTRAAEEAKVNKRREIEKQQSPYSAYIPPPRPPHKSKDVYVTIVKESSSKHVPKDEYDDEDGHYKVEVDKDLTDRYKILKLLGQGTFGKVVEAWDKQKNSKCAIKIIRSVQKYRDASRIELRVLSTLAQNDERNRNKCIHLRHCFDFRNHICIVTDLYGQSVFDFLKSNAFTPFPNSHIQLFARQLLTSVAFLHDLNLIHTDLKPENILLVDNTYQTFTYNRAIPSSTTTTNRTSRHRKVLLNPEIRLIDFGSATFEDEYHSSVVSTRHYRAPEIILNLGWSYPCDIWSIGCILVEFFTGDALFQTHDNLEHLAMMEPVCNGKIDKELINRVFAKERSSKNPAAAYFTKNKKLDYPNADTPRNSRRYVKAMKKLDQCIPRGTTDFGNQFLDLLKKIFVYDPAKRITAKQALQHPWFKESSNDDGTEAARIRDEKLKQKALQDRRTNGGY